MDWSDIGKLVARAAPVLGTALGGPVGATAGALVASIFGVEATPHEVEKAIHSDPEAAIKLRQLEMENGRDLRRMALAAQTARLAEINATYRQELGSEDGYVRRARPTFLYIIAFSVLVEVVLAGLVILVVPDRLSDLATLYGALATPQSIAAGMCGVYLKKRSDDKSVAATGQTGPGLLSSLMTRLGGAK